MAGRLETAWRALEEFDGLAATRRRWEAVCGQALFRFVEPFLGPTGEQAEWIPDPTDRLRQMFRHQDREFLAISEEEPRSPDVPLSRQELEVYRLDLARFGRQIASSLGLGPTHGLDVILVLPCREDDLLRILDSIRARIRGEFALITPTHHTVVPHVREAIDNGAFQHATLGVGLATRVVVAVLPVPGNWGGRIAITLNNLLPFFIPFI